MECIYRISSEPHQQHSSFCWLPTCMCDTDVILRYRFWIATQEAQIQAAATKRHLVHCCLEHPQFGRLPGTYTELQHVVYFFPGNARVQALCVIQVHLALRTDKFVNFDHLDSERY